MGLLFEEESFAIRGAIYEVYKNLGAGFLEAVYQEALELELTTRHIPFKAQFDIGISYKGFPLRQTYRVDVVCFDKIILELETVCIFQFDIANTKIMLISIVAALIKCCANS